jgi:hypothetical protein
MQCNTGRRGALKGLGAGLMAAGLVAGRSAQAAVDPVLALASAQNLHELALALAALPRRRDFKTVPMILDNADWWDAAALEAVLAYKGGPKQSWDHTELSGPWLNVMRNSMNAQVWSFRHPDFLCVSATHGSAHLALYDQATWDKYQLAKIAGWLPRSRALRRPNRRRAPRRRTPLFLMQHLVEAGVTWKSEAIFQEEIGNPIGHVDIPIADNTLAVYSAATVPDAPHLEAARAWLDFIRSDAAFKVFERYGFKRYEAPPG